MDTYLLHNGRRAQFRHQEDSRQKQFQAPSPLFEKRRSILGCFDSARSGNRDIQTTDLGGKAGISFWYLGNAEQRLWRRLKNSEYRLRVLRVCPWNSQGGTNALDHTSNVSTVQSQTTGISAMDWK